MLLCLLLPLAFAEEPPEGAPPEEAGMAPPGEAQALPGAAAPDPAVIHDELRALRTQLLEALETQDIDALLETVHPNIVLTTTAGEVVRGHEGVRKYIDKTLNGPDAVVKSFKFDVSSDELSILYDDDTAIAWGPSLDHYVFTDGSAASLDTRWSATLVEHEGRWLVASFHSSVDVFDNAVLNRVTALVPQVGIGAGIGGLLLGGVLGLLLGRSMRRVA
jgi:uncharacterized protein (TIGR02246 family)